MHADKGEGKWEVCVCLSVCLNGESWVKTDRLEDREIERYTVWSVRLAG